MDWVESGHLEKLSLLLLDGSFLLIKIASCCNTIASVSIRLLCIMMESQSKMYLFVPIYYIDVSLLHYSYLYIMMRLTPI